MGSAAGQVLRVFVVVVVVVFFVCLVWFSHDGMGLASHTVTQLTWAGKGLFGSYFQTTVDHQRKSGQEFKQGGFKAPDVLEGSEPRECVGGTH